MSVFEKTTVRCPSCGTASEFRAVLSINGGRRPDLREGVLDGTFQRQECAKCGKAFRLAPQTTYVDDARGQWIGVFPAQDVARWQAREASARAAFDRAYGRRAPEAARAIGARMRPRVVFGWGALREKLVAADAGIDDVALEAAKAAVVRNSERMRLTASVELRLLEASGDECTMAWIRAGEDAVVEGLVVPRALIDGIAADPRGWNELRAELSIGLFVDLNRLLVESR